MNALVLSGGSIKGAFQAGAIAHVLNRGFAPDLLCGISVGSLNAAFLADRAGRAKIAGHEPDWPKIGAELEAFWRQRVTKPADIAKIQSRWKIAWKALWKKFDGLAQTGFLKELVSKEVFVENLQASPVQLRVGAVNLVNGDIVYARKPRRTSSIISSRARRSRSPCRWSTSAARLFTTVACAILPRSAMRSIWARPKSFRLFHPGRYSQNA